MIAIVITYLKFFELPPTMSLLIFSGGQTGVDRAALDAAIHLGIEHGGWCPKNRNAEDGTIDARYGLKETNSDSYDERTLLNIRDSDATLVLIPEECDVKSISDGTKLTVNQLIAVSKPYLVISVTENEDNNRGSLDKCRQWLSSIQPKCLNIAGPRESTSPGIYDKSLKFLMKLLSPK